MKLGISSYTYTWAIGMPGILPAYPMNYTGLIEKVCELDVGRQLRRRASRGYADSYCMDT